MSAAGVSSFSLRYVVSPIILWGGVTGVPGRGIPIINFTQPGAYENAILSPTGSIDLDNFFAHYHPMAGATLIDNQIAQYPFANQSIAANAIITQPLRVSLLMICPVRDAGGYQNKTQIMQALQNTLAQHNNLGGTYTIATPSFTYRNCIMTSFRDIGDGESRQAQTHWQIDFVQPLLTLEQAALAMNLQMQAISNSVPIPGDPPHATGASQSNSAIGAATVPSSRPLIGAAP